MKKFRFTLFLIVIFILVYLSVKQSVTGTNHITVKSITQKGSYIYITGEISPYKSYKGYEYSSDKEKCYIKIYSSLRLFGGDNKFKIHVGDFNKIYLTDGKSEKEIK